MRFFAVGQEAEGFIALGQVATGVIAIGQLATGVIAIGQVARGVVAVGMVAFGLVSVGMLSGGLVFAAGMLGAGGRGVGLVLPVVPVPKRRPKLPELVPLEVIRASGREGWIAAKLRLGGGGAPELVQDGVALPLTLAKSLLAGATSHAQIGSDVVARVVPKGQALRVEELKAVPRASWGWIARVVQVVALVVLAYAYWNIVLVDLGDLVVRTARAMLAGQVV